MSKANEGSGSWQFKDPLVGGSELGVSMSRMNISDTDLIEFHDTETR